MVRKNTLANILVGVGIITLVGSILLLILGLLEYERFMISLTLPNFVMQLSTGALLIGIGELIRQMHHGFGEAVLSLQKIEELMKSANKKQE